jgi:putative RNA 2'-phosphotransferase
LTDADAKTTTARDSQWLPRAVFIRGDPKEEKPMSRDLVTVSKFLSKHLRHAPEALGLTLEPGGWVSVDELLRASERAGFAIAYDELLACVETSDKQRFAFDDTGDRIRANQGHSVAVDLQLDAKQPPDVLYHGTVERFLAAILAEGLKKGKRHHVDLSRDVETARRVGARRGKPVILQVDAATMHAQGIQFFVSANGVWLTDAVPAIFLTRSDTNA